MSNEKKDGRQRRVKRPLDAALWLSVVVALADNIRGNEKH